MKSEDGHECMNLTGKNAQVLGENVKMYVRDVM
jgi:hypothetical protein